jgi:hypothetical protein
MSVCASLIILDQLVAIYEINCEGLANEHNLDTILYNSVASTISKRRSNF